MLKFSYITHALHVTSVFSVIYSLVNETWLSFYKQFSDNIMNICDMRNINGLNMYDSNMHNPNIHDPNIHDPNIHGSISNNDVEYEDIEELKILKFWIVAFQCRYILTDSLSIYNMMYNKKHGKILSMHYMYCHFLESVICFFMFRYTKNYAYSYICLVWSMLWYISLRKSFNTTFNITFDKFKSFFIHLIPAYRTVR